MENISETAVSSIAIGLSIITLLVLVLPLTIKKIGENMEPFLLFMGLIAVTISGAWSWQLLHFAVIDPVATGPIPIGIFQVVLGAGLLLHFFSQRFFNGICYLTGKLGHRLFIFLLIAVLSLISGVISVILTAVLLTEVIATLPFPRRKKIEIVVAACYGVGLGAVLTPVAEPLATVMVDKLSGSPYNAGFFFPLTVLGIYVIPGIIILALASAFFIGRNLSEEAGMMPITVCTEFDEPLKSVILRATRVYLFIAALTLLGEGLKPLILWYFSKVPGLIMYWLNIASAFLDNATLASIELTPTMTLPQIIGATLGLLIAGGMLIPGNIPNIVAAGRLKIGMMEWAKIGVPLGLVLMSAYFIILLIRFGTGF
jgi:predicted cation transporter